MKKTTTKTSLGRKIRNEYPEKVEGFSAKTWETQEIQLTSAKAIRLAPHLKHLFLVRGPGSTGGVGLISRFFLQMISILAILWILYGARRTSG